MSLGEYIIEIMAQQLADDIASSSSSSNSTTFACSTTISDKRALSASSETEMSAEKRAKSSPSATPIASPTKVASEEDADDSMKQMMRKMLTEIVSVKAELTHVRNEGNARRDMLSELRHEFSGMRVELDTAVDRLTSVEMRLADTERQLTAANKKNTKLETKLNAVDQKTNRQKDEACRASLTVHWIPRKKLTKPDDRESWTDTQTILATFLSEKCGLGSVPEIEQKITWAHRSDKPDTDVIHVQMESWKYQQEIMECFRRKKGKVGLVYVLEKFSDDTTERRNKCNERRKEIRAKHNDAKVWIKYPATLMCKFKGEKKYKEVAKF